MESYSILTLLYEIQKIKNFYTLKNQTIMRYFIYLFSAFLLFSFTENLHAQASTIIEKDSDNIDSPQLLILETESGTGNGEGWGRIWFQNQTDMANRWAIAARSNTGATNQDGTLNQPIVFAYNGDARLSVSKEGNVRFNNQYIFPNLDGAADQVLQTDGSGNLSWTDMSAGTSYWTAMTGGIEYNGLVKVNPTSPITFNDPALTTQVNRASLEPMMSIRNTNGIGDAATFVNAGANYWTFGLDNDKNAFKINRLFDGINTTLDDGTQRFTILGSNGFVGLGTDAPGADLDLANDGADIRFSDSNASSIQWYESGTEVAFLGHNGNNVVLKNDDTNGDITIDAQDDILFRANGVNKMILQNSGEVSIEDVLRLKPRSVAPTCANGRMYYNSTNHKVYVCSNGSWVALN